MAQLEREVAESPDPLLRQHWASLLASEAGPAARLRQLEESPWETTDFTTAHLESKLTALLGAGS